MSKIKPKRCKKYNPNKSRDLELRKIAQYKEAISHVYEMEVTFFSNEVGIYLDQQKDLCERLKAKFKCKGIPYNIAAAAYKNNDFIICCLLGLTKADVYQFDAEVYFIKEGEPMITVPFTRVIGNTGHSGLYSGDPKAIVNDDGFKRVGWKGVNEEILDHLSAYEKRKPLPEGYALGQIQVKFFAEVQFISVAAYKEYLEVVDHIKKGHEAISAFLYLTWCTDALRAQEQKEQAA